MDGWMGGWMDGWKMNELKLVNVGNMWKCD